VPRAFTIEEVSEFYAKHGCTLLETEYKGMTQKLRFLCKCGEIGCKRFANFKLKPGCAKCFARSKKLDYEYVRKAFEAVNYTLVSETYEGSNSKLEYICDKGHHGFITWRNFNSGQRCRTCKYDKMRESIDDIRKQVEEEGYTLLTKEFKNAWQKLDMICPNGHHVSIKWSHFKNDGQRCRYCFFESLIKQDKSDEQRIRERSYFEYSQWRKEVFERDDYTCQVCLKRGGKLHAHHLYSYADYPELRTDINNGTTLCADCHSNKSTFGFHRLYGLFHNTPEQFEEYKSWRRKQLGIDIDGIERGDKICVNGT
jgi:hypothetical protein